MIDLPDFTRFQSSLSDSDWKQLQLIIAAVREIQAALVTAQATIADHEDRITVLEP